MTLLFSGVRVSELVELTMDDVTISERSGSIRVRAGKVTSTDGSDRKRVKEVPFPIHKY